jgi:hypothetical protein
MSFLADRDLDDENDFRPQRYHVRGEWYRLSRLQIAEILEHHQEFIADPPQEEFP